MKNIFLFGDSGVGKTTFCKAFTDGAFTNSYTATYIMETVLIGDKTFYDFSGQDNQSELPILNIVPDTIVLFFDYTSRISFNNLPKWLNRIKTTYNYSVPIVLIGTKKDCKERYNKISEDDVNAMKLTLQSSFYEISNKDIEEVRRIGMCLA